MHLLGLRIDELIAFGEATLTQESSLNVFDKLWGLTIVLLQPRSHFDSFLDYLNTKCKTMRKLEFAAFMNVGGGILLSCDIIPNTLTQTQGRNKICIGNN